jgi:hypothetical protein
MNKTARGAFIGCGGVLALLGIAIIGLTVLSGPSEAPPHKYDSFRKDPDACIAAFDGRRSPAFSHIWVLHSPDLEAWWGPNGLRAEAEMILDSADQEVIGELLTHSGATSRSPNHARTLPEGRIYHVLLFNESQRVYAHLRFSYRSEQSDGTTTFNLVTDFNGASPVKDCPGFLEFEKRRLNTKKNNRENKP